MGEDSNSVRGTLQELWLHAQTDKKGRETARAALAAELDRLLYKTEGREPDDGARAFLVDMLSEKPTDEKEALLLIRRVDAMAFGEHKNEHPENKRAAGIVHVTRNSEIGDRMIRKNMLKADAKDERLHSYARNLAGLLLVKQWREELKQNNDMGFYTEAKEFMDNETEFLRGTRVEVAKFLLDFCISAGKAFPVVAEIATSGKWPDLAEEAGKWLIDHYIGTKDVGMAKRVADAPGTLQSVKEYAAKRFEEIGFRPIERREDKKTMIGMPAFKPEAMRAKIEAARGVPPSPVEMTPGRKGVITLRGPGVK